MNPTNNYVEFKKERDLGATITDAFKFIRLEWKPFFATIFKASIIPLIVLIGAIIMYLYSIYDAVNTIDYYDNSDPFAGFGSVFFYIGIASLAGLVVYVLAHLSGLHYIKEYVNNKGSVTYENVMSGVKKNFWGFTGLSVLIVVTLIVSFMICFLPILYTWPIMTLLPMIYVFGNKGVFDSYGHSFSYVSGKHWADTFGIMFVVSLIVSVLGSVFSIPSMIYQFIQMGTILESNDPTETFNMFKDPIYILLTVISYIGQYFMYAITLITNVFIYYDINEQKNASGTLEKIDSIGQS
ncbi:MAG: hypothetical protein JXQ93_11755 [Flavobacteriaceae bacterium]